MKVAAIYRVSTEKQLRHDSDDTIPLQRAAVREFIAQRDGWTLVREYAEEGVSGFKVSAEDRDVLQGAFQDAKNGMWQALVVFKADRLSRNALEYPVVIDRFRRIGCEIWSVKDAPGGKLLALDTQMDKFVRFLEGWQAETESMNTSIRVSERMLQLAKAGKWSGGRSPYGFRHNDDRKPKSDELALLIDPEQAQVVRLMVDLYLDERMGGCLIARELNRRGVPNCDGRPWDDQKVRRVLQNPIIAGLPAYNRNRRCGNNFTRKNPYDLDQFVLPRDEAGNLSPVPEYQIVPLDRWLRLMAAMKTARSTACQGEVRHTVSARIRAADALLTGILFCGHCGARLSADASRIKSRHRDGTVSYGRKLYYECRTQLHKGRPFCDGQRTYGCKRLERVVIAQLEALLTMLDAGELAALLLGDEQKARAEARVQIRLLEAGVKKAERILEGWLARMDAFLASPGESPYSEEILTGKIREARERSETARRALREALAHGAVPGASPQQIAELVRVAPQWWKCFADAPNAEKKVMIRDLVERINVRRNEVEIQFRVDLQSFLPKAREMAATRTGEREIVGSSHQSEPRL